MSVSKSSRIPSLLKKFLMAASGLILVLFVLGHMLGNLTFLMGPEAINAYAHKLHSLPGHPFSLWAIRLFLLGCVGLHIWMAILLTMENKAARPVAYDVKKPQKATYAARTMPMSGLILLAFIVFHILHYTARVAPEPYNETIGDAMISVGYGTVIPTFDVFAMMVKGFSNIGVSLFYIVAVGLLCVHLTHGVSSMFQSIGLRNEIWRERLNKVALAYGLIIFLGFAVIPSAVIFGGYGKDYLAEQTVIWENGVNSEAEQTLLAKESSK